MAKISGVDVLLKVNTAAVGSPATYTTIGGQTSAVLNRKADSIDTTSKDSGGWKESLAGFKSWTLECDGFIVDADAGFDALETSFNTGSILLVELTLPSGKSYQGSAHVTDMPITYPNDNAATIKITLDGTGALVLGTIL